VVQGTAVYSVYLTSLEVVSATVPVSGPEEIRYVVDGPSPQLRSAYLRLRDPAGNYLYYGPSATQQLPDGRWAVVWVVTPGQVGTWEACGRLSVYPPGYWPRCATFQVGGIVDVRWNPDLPARDRLPLWSDTIGLPSQRLSVVLIGAGVENQPVRCHLTLPDGSEREDLVYSDASGVATCEGPNYGVEMTGWWHGRVWAEARPDLVREKDWEVVWYVWKQAR
jgi:hypothetical protein